MSTTPSSEDRHPSGALAEVVDRMAHQLRNPLQAVMVNLEVLRARVRNDAPELWEELERFASAVDQNAALLNTRLELLVKMARGTSDEEPGAVDLAALCRDLVTAVGFDQEEPEVSVRGQGVPARARRGRLVELLYLLLRETRRGAAGGAGGDGVEVRVEAEGGEASLEVRGGAVGTPEDAGAGDAERWEELARQAGGALTLPGGDGPVRARLTLPSA